MPYKRPFYLSILAAIHALLLFAGIYPVLASIMEYEGIQFWRVSTSGVLIMIPILFNLALVHNFRHFSTYFLAGILVSALSGLLACCWGGLHRPAGTLCGICTALLSMVIFCIRTSSKIRFGRLKRDFQDFHGKTAVFSLHERDMPDMLTRPHPLHWIWFTMLYLAGMAGSFTTYLHCMFGIVFADIFICLGFCYGNAICKYISENRKVSHLPVSAMCKIHRMTGIAAAFLLFLFLLPSVFFGREFRFNPSFDYPGLSGDSLSGQPEEDNMMQDFSDLLPDGESTPPPEWLMDLMQFFGGLLIFIFACALIRAILGWLRKIGQEFAAEDDDEVLFLQEEPADFIQRALRRRHGERQSPEAQIRRRYRKMIRRATKGQPSKWATPSELEAQAALPDTGEVRKLHEAYELARYGKNR